jgi:chaperonin GroEL
MNNQGYSPRDIAFDEVGRKKLLKGVQKLAKTVKSTLGPSGSTVILESPHHTHGMTITKDGTTVARDIEFLDPVENLAARMTKVAAKETANLAGDGTTTAIVLTEALVKAGMNPPTAKNSILRYLQSKFDVSGINDKNKNETLRELKKLSDSVQRSLELSSKTITDQNLIDVATISANNDSDIGKLIADVYRQVGINGVVTIANSETSDTYIEATSGVKIDRGYANPLFVNSQEKDECVMEDVSVLVSDAEISNIFQIENVLKPIIKENRSFLIIAPCSQNMLNTLAANKMKNGLKLCVIQPPSFGYKQHELMSDIAVCLGATYFSQKTGDDLSIIEFSDLGHADRIVADKDQTVITKTQSSESSAKLDIRVAELKKAREIANKKEDKDFISSRIASLVGGIGVIKVGGHTSNEQKELYDRVEDAVCAVRSALEEGILPGGGVALYRESLMIDASETSLASEILSVALKAPLLQILANAGMEEDILRYGPYQEYEEGINVKTGEFGNMYDLGVIDPLKVTKSALKNAVSVAVSILSTNAIVTMARSYETT